MYCLISTFSKTFDELGLIYFIPSFLEKEIKNGQIVEIPIGTKIEIGVILEIGESKEINTLNINKEKIKSLISIKNKNIFLDTNRIILAKFISSYYFTHIHNSISLFFPKNLRDKITKDKLKLEIKRKLEYSFNFDKKLSIRQEEIFNQINKNKNNKFLLHGVTGSGKTEIYIRLIKEELKKGKQSLLLIPEIILTNQLSERLKDVFGEDIVVLNSSVPEAKKTNFWIDIYTDNAKIIIGTRSALFYPYTNLGLIIIDEEHDNSYQSDSAPRYNSIDIANKITDLYGNKLLLASGTPSINSMYKAVKGKYKLLKLLEKY